MGENVLLIDDEESVLKSVGAYFERLGAEVYRAASGEEGIATFERVRPDLLITDLHLPGISGLDVLERLVPQGASVILMTGQGDIETAVRAMQLGAEHFLTKPINLTHLGAAAARVWEKVRRRRETPGLPPRGPGAAGLEPPGNSPRCAKWSARSSCSRRASAPPSSWEARAVRGRVGWRAACTTSAPAAAGRSWK